MFRGFVRVLCIYEIADGIFDMTLDAPEAAAAATAGQFINLYTGDRSKLLPRPISICRINRRKGTLRIVFRVVGEGTRMFSELIEGENVSIMGPVGNGFPDTEIKKAVLFGGGIGIPPMLGLAEKLHSEGVKVISVLGYRNRQTFLSEEFEKFGEVVIASDDGSVGFHGNVVQAAGQNEAIKEVFKDVDKTAVFACGPLPMLKGVKALSGQYGIPAWISMEERMACGVGACLGCVVKTVDIDEHSKVTNKRVCKDGPVFSASELDLS